MQSEERVQIFIDGGNFHHLVLKKLGAEEQDFSFEKFTGFLANGRVITERGKRFYVGTVRERPGDERSKLAMSKQNDTAIVVSSDGDLIPAIDWIRKRQNKKVEYIGFSIIDSRDRANDTKAAQGLITNSDIHRILIASDIQQFITPTLLQ